VQFGMPVSRWKQHLLFGVKMGLCFRFVEVAHVSPHVYQFILRHSTRLNSAPQSHAQCQAMLMLAGKATQARITPHDQILNCGIAQVRNCGIEKQPASTQRTLAKCSSSAIPHIGNQAILFVTMLGRTIESRDYDMPPAVSGELIRMMNYVDDISTTLRRITASTTFMTPEERKRLADYMRKAEPSFPKVLEQLERGE
jgi:hypothetical protein